MAFGRAQGGQFATCIPDFFIECSIILRPVD
jgi:hypothetical protein